jgi:hypothetical protein
MVVITSVFVAELNRTDALDERLPVAEQVNSLEEAARELISLYEGKNRVEPIE